MRGRIRSRGNVLVPMNRLGACRGLGARLLGEISRPESHNMGDWRFLEGVKKHGHAGTGTILPSVHIPGDDAKAFSWMLTVCGPSTPVKILGQCVGGPVTVAVRIGVPFLKQRRSTCSW